MPWIRMVVLGLWLAALPAAAQTPNPATVRLQVSQVLGAGEKAPPAPSIGRIGDVAGLSISYGAPAYNDGDIEGCMAFYRRSMADLLTTWEGAKSPDPVAADALRVLREALNRAEGFEDPARKAWALRYGWDRVLLMQSMELVEIRGLLGIGDESMARAQYPEAVAAYAAATEKLRRAGGTEPRQLEVEVRFAAIALGHARFGARDFEGAGEAISEGLLLIPDWLDYGVDRAAHHPPGEYELHLSALEGAVLKDGKNAGLQFLLAYEYAMTGKTKEADDLVLRVLALDPKHGGARVLAAGLAGRGPRGR